MKKIWFLMLGCMLAFQLSAQQNLYKWRVGIHGGLGTYYGDLSTGRILDPQTDVLRFWDNKENISYGISLEKSLSKAWGLRFMTTHGSFQANDRATKWNGAPYTQSQNYNRALNFRTSYNDLDVIFVYQFDNGKFFGEKSFFAPYIGTGVGFMKYKVRGDLYQENGNRYYYWSDNTIRDLGESDPNAANASIIEQDGIYETDLRELETEGRRYSETTLTIPLAMGLKFRLNDRINLNLETLLHYSLSDYLDDVSGDYPVLFGSIDQAYASNPTNTPRSSRGAGNNLKDIYGVFNISIGYNFGYKKQAFNAPVFYLGESDIPVAPVVKEEVVIEEIRNEVNEEIIIEKEVIIREEESIKDANIIIENATIQSLHVDTIIQGKNEVQVIRDTVYEPGKVIEKVIIRTDTIREIIKEDQTFIETEPLNSLEPIREESITIIDEPIDTFITINPITNAEDTLVYIGDVAVEEVPEGPVFTLEEIERIDIEELSPVFFEEEIGYLKDDLSEEEVVLSEVQETNFELVALRNEINELKAKEDKSPEEVETLYQKLDELGADFRKYEQYNNSLALQENGTNEEEKEEFQKASEQLGKELNEVRTEIIYLESPIAQLSDAEYERIRAENDKRFKELEKQMRKLRKAVRKSKRNDIPPREKVEAPKEEKTEVIIQTPPPTVIVENGNPQLDKMYTAQLLQLQAEVNRLKNDNLQLNTNKNAEITALNQKVLELERKLNAVQTTGNSDSQTIAYISNLENKLDGLSQQLQATQNELTALSNRPIPEPKTITVQTPPAQVISTISPAREAVNKLGSVNVYFGTGKSYVRTEFFNELDRVINIMKQYPEVTAILTGYTDKSGNPDANLRLSMKRSDAVKSYLTKRGISSGRISVNNYGDSRSSAKDDPFSRRVEINLNAF